jgi:hypothetical protein
MLRELMACRPTGWRRRSAIWLTRGELLDQGDRGRPAPRATPDTAASADVGIPQG